MGQLVAKLGDLVVGLDTHIVQIPSPAGPVPTPLPSPFTGELDGEGSGSVYIDDKAAAVVGTKATNKPGHIPTAGPFQTPPSNSGKVSAGSSSVFADDVGMARAGDPAACCNDPCDQETGQVIVAASTVYAG